MIRLTLGRTRSSALNRLDWPLQELVQFFLHRADIRRQDFRIRFFHIL